MSLFLCMSTFEGIAHTALCKALCLLLYRKLEIPSNAKPTNLEIIVLEIPLLLFLPSENFGKIKSNLFFNICYLHI